jgi:hypothetical protein
MLVVLHGITHDKVFCLDGCEDLEPNVSYSFFNATYVTKMSPFIKPRKERERKEAKRQLTVEDSISIPLWIGVLEFDQ